MCIRNMLRMWIHLISLVLLLLWLVSCTLLEEKLLKVVHFMVLSIKLGILGINIYETNMSECMGWWGICVLFILLYVYEPNTQKAVVFYVSQVNLSGWSVILHVYCYWRVLTKCFSDEFWVKFILSWFFFSYMKTTLLLQKIFGIIWSEWDCMKLMKTIQYLGMLSR